MQSRQKILQYFRRERMHWMDDLRSLSNLTLQFDYIHHLKQQQQEQQQQRQHLNLYKKILMKLIILMVLNFNFTDLYFNLLKKNHPDPWATKLS